MHDVVDLYLKMKNLGLVYDFQKKLLEDFQVDFAKHLDENETQFVNKNELIKIVEVYKTIPYQLSKENSKFQYTLINKNSRGRDYRSAIDWLEEFGLINICF